MLRKRKNRRYNEESNDGHDEGGRSYNLREKIRCERFEQLEDLQDLPGDSITMKWIQLNGFDKPILVRNPAGLDLRVPPKGFLVKDVGKLVGNDRMIDVMDVTTQKNIEMSMKDWCKYYESRNRDRLLNVISLEFSHTGLDPLVDSPKIVKLLDWVDLVWPKFLKESQTESTNSIDKMKYPKVQKYCLMSVKGSYTDFHIDFGGTSVWYHILRGKKIFWMCPPTELNLQAFEEWTLSGFQQDIFFGDTVEKCFRVELCAGNTFFIPSGWIHAVYTVEDSLVFGGNFLHSFGIENQLKVARIEDSTKVPIKFRYPFYTEMLWYVVQHYVYCLTGKSHLHDTTKISGSIVAEKVSKQNNDEVLTESEQDESDNKKKAASPRKRGRPPKSSTSRKPPKPPSTDDESTEIDTEDEDSKPSKNVATCRMTKNSLLRLQYEIDDTNLKSATCTKSSKVGLDVKSKAGISQKEGSANSRKEETPKSETKSSQEASQFRLSDLVTPAKLNGWSLGQSGSNQTIWSNPMPETKESIKIHITKFETSGLKSLVKHLSKLSGAKKNLPTLIRNSRALLDDCKKVITEHENDDPDLAASGLPVGPELQHPKKSDINQLIEQFFKPTEHNSDYPISSDASSPLLSKSDSSTLTHQQRLKYSQSGIDGKDEKKTSSNDNAGSKVSSPRREAKTSSPNKKSLNPATPSITSHTATTSTSSSNTDQPRPKSPPTRPLSNKQYTSKSKTENNLILPGSFADLIAATSTAKEVFEVSSTDVTSSLFGLKSTSPTKQMLKIERPSAATLLPKSSLDDDSGQASPTSSSTKMQKKFAPKPISPEPPKISPPKRFINPAYRPQNKEKLIFASAPYVSPVSVSDQAKSSGLYPWQSPAPSYSPASVQASHHSSNQQKPQQNEIVATNSPIPLTPHHTVKGQSIEDLHQPSTDTTCTATPVEYNLPRERTIIDKSPQQAGTTNVSDNKPTLTTHQRAAIHDKNLDDTQSRIDEKQTNMIEKTVAATATPIKQETMDATISNGCEQDKMKKPHKPRGPPKKSKEARLAIESEMQTNPIPIIRLTDTQTTPVIQSESSYSTSISKVIDVCEDKPSEKEKERSKTKRIKKSKDDKGTKQDTTPKPGASVVNQTRPPVICGLVASSINSTGNPTVQSSKAGTQQYLISRPLLLNSMPTLSPSHIQQRAVVPGSTLPIFTSPIVSVGMPNMQQGARIVWATRPGGIPIVPSSSNSSSTHTSTQSKPKNQKPATSTPTVNNRQSDNAALLSLATTALSTAPLPTTPTLSRGVARIPNVSQALMVNPLAPGGQQALLARQQLFSPFIQRLPIVQFAARPANHTPAMAPLLRPGPPRSGQLLFSPLPNQIGQPRYLLTQPGFLPPGPHAAPLFVGQPANPTMAYAAFPPTEVNPTKESVKVKKVKTR